MIAPALSISQASMPLPLLRLSGRIADVCAELDRLLALDQASTDNGHNEVHEYRGLGRLSGRRPQTSLRSQAG